MTPCEKIGLKVGDEVSITKTGAAYSGLNVGECLVLVEDDNSTAPFFRTKNNGALICLSIVTFGTEEALFEKTKAEAEKRGAKFGTMGVEKATGKKCVWIAESLVLPGYWEIDVEGQAERWHRRPEEIRLEHEPEFKEVRFNEATHEQRMVAENVRDEFGQNLIDIFWSEKSSIYIVLLETGETDVLSPVSGRFTVRIPS